LRRFVLDACVAAKWYLDEEYSDAALHLAASAPEWIAPDLFFAEVGNVLWKKVRRGEMDEADARDAMTGLLSMELKVRATSSLVLYGLELALHFQCTVYDGLYLAAAIDEASPLVTADRKFYRTFSESALGNHLLWIEDAI